MSWHLGLCWVCRFWFGVTVGRLQTCHGPEPSLDQTDPLPSVSAGCSFPDGFTRLSAAAMCHRNNKNLLMVAECLLICLLCCWSGQKISANLRVCVLELRFHSSFSRTHVPVAKLRKSRPESIRNLVISRMKMASSDSPGFYLGWKGYQLKNWLLRLE